MFIKNTKDVEEFSADRFVRSNLFQEGKTNAFTLNFLPGQSFPPHPHPNAHIYLFVVQGTGTCTIDGKEYPISQEDVVHVADRQMLGIENTSEAPLRILVVQAKGVLS